MENWTVSSNQTRQLSFKVLQTSQIRRTDAEIFLGFTLLFQRVSDEEEVIIDSVPILLNIINHSISAVQTGTPIMGTHYLAGTTQFLAVAPSTTGASESIYTKEPIVFLRSCHTLNFSVLD